MATTQACYDFASPTVITEATEEQALLQRLAQGDNHAFWDLWKQYRAEGLEWHSLRWMRGNPADAEDALSVSSIKAFQHLTEHPQKIGCMKSWLAQLVHNHCRDMWKARQRQAHYVGDTNHLLDTIPLAVQVTQTGLSVEDTLLQNELGIYIRRAFDTLPSRLREPALLRFVHDMSYTDIAAQLHLRSDNIRKRIQQARRHLQQQLSAYQVDQVNGTSCKADIGPRTADTQYTDLEGLTILRPQRAALPEMRPEPLGEQPPIATSTFSITLSTGAEQQLYLTLDQKPTRQQQKVTTLRRYIQQHPQGRKKHLELADLLYTMGQWEEAIATYRQVLRKNPDSIAVWVRLGEMLHTLQQEENAINAYEQARSWAQREVTQHHIDGLIANCRGHHAAAVQALEAAIALEADNPVHQRALGFVHLQAARPVEALDAFDAVLQNNPDDLVVLTHSYEALRITGHDTEAHRRVTRAVDLDPNHVLALTYVARHLTTTSQGAGPLACKSRKLIRHALNLAPHAPEVHVALAYDHIVRGKWTKGLDLLNHFAEAHPRCPASWYYAAHWHARTGHIERAADAIQQAYDLAPNDPNIIRAASAIRIEANKESTLRPLVQQMLQQFPDDWRLQTTAGDALMQVYGEAERACEVAARGPTLQPHLPQAWFQYGQILARASQPQAAIAVFQEGWSRLPAQDAHRQSTPTALWLWECYQAVGDPVTAQTWWHEAHRLAVQLTASHSALGHYWQGKVWIAAKRPERARSLLQTALRQHLLCPARQDALTQLATCT